MHRLLLLAAFLFSTTAMAQSLPASDFDRSKDPENGAVVFKGAVTLADLQKEPSFAWLATGMKAYTPQADAVQYLKTHLPGYELVVLMGTWCDDSQQQLPRLFKTLQAAGYPAEQVTMFGVDRAKEAKNVERRIYNVERVPTIILYKDHQEVGRIVEAPKTSIEGDLEAMIKGKDGTAK